MSEPDGMDFLVLYIEECRLSSLTPERLRARYLRGEIEIEEFERDLGKLYERKPSLWSFEPRNPLVRTNS